MNLSHLKLQPCCSYSAVARIGILSGTIATFHKLRLQTNGAGQVASFSIEGLPEDSQLSPDGFDFLRLTNIATGAVSDLRLHTAAVAEVEYSRDLADAALREGASVHERIAQGSTPLHWAAAKGRTWLAQTLVRHGADVDATDDVGWTPLFLALENRQAETADYLVYRRASPRAVINGKPVQVQLAPSTPNLDLISAAQFGEPEGIASALRAGAEVNCRNPHGATPLLCAATTNPGTVEALLAAGADPNLALASGLTPAARAKQAGKREIEQVLARYGA